MNEKQVIRIHGIGSSLQGVGRLEDGRAAFVRGALPGETVEIEVEKDAGRYVVARLLGVREPSEQRCAPFCPHYGKCGGCAAQHMDYAATLACKQTVVRDALARIGGQKEIEVLPTIGMQTPLHYRNKVEYAVAPDGSLGFSMAGSHAVVPAVECPLAEEAILPAAKAVERWLKTAGRESRLRYVVARSTKQGDVMLVLSGERLAGEQALYEMLPEHVRSVHFCRLKFRPAHALDGETRHLRGSKTLTEELAGMRFGLSAQSFFQVNRSQCEELLARAVEFATAEQKGALAADVYCGVGTLSLAMAQSPEIEKVLGFEIVPQAIRDAKENARANGLAGKTQFFAGDAALTLPGEIRGRELCAAIIDPPRKGTAPEVLRALAASKPRRICYVSCNPATLARDIALLAGQYSVALAQPVDMFPWTEHVETVVLLHRGEASAGK
ncbi:MAG: 23S rRNA (uracil(1939)-C(5))-methyltransferase RlmD [Eubacteriales bacterium]|nr:23S rRNA (uracil(1939)-C(5))-methyltransferase RlmD [Eubacteriales bacterium]